MPLIKARCRPTSGMMPATPLDQCLGEGGPRQDFPPVEGRASQGPSWPETQVRGLPHSWEATGFSSSSEEWHARPQSPLTFGPGPALCHAAER